MKEQSTLSAPGELAIPRVERPWWKWADAALIALGLMGVYAFAFSYPTMFPEYAWAWSINYGMTADELLHKYVEFGSGWYKPTELHAYFVFLGKVLDWHNPFHFRVVTLLELYGVALMFYALVRRAFPEERPAALLTALLFVSHPTLFIFTYENLGNALLYALFMLGSALCYLSIERERSGPSWAMWASGLFLYVGALTCREQTVALPAVLVAIYVIGWLSRRAQGRPATPLLNRLQLSFLAISIVFTAIYWRLHVSRMSPLAGGYRNVFVWSWVKRNATVLPEWFVYYFSDPESSFLLNPNALLINTIFGAVLGVLALGAWAWALKKTRGKALAELAYLFAFTLGFLAIPVYSGGEPWHVLVPIGGVSALFSVALVRLATLLPQARVRMAALGAVMIGVVALGAYNFRMQFLHSRPDLYHLNQEAVASPPVPRESMPKGALVYYNSMGLADWNFGASHLFDFTYFDPQLKQRGVTDEERTNLEIASDWLAAPHAFYFAWRNAKWIDETSAFRTVALSGVQQAITACVAASQCDVVAGRLKAIVEKHPELDTLEKQLDCLPRHTEPECQLVLTQAQP